MSISALSQAMSASNLVQAQGLAAEFKSIVPSDLFIAWAWAVGLIIAWWLKPGVLYNPSFTLTGDLARSPPR